MVGVSTENRSAPYLGRAANPPEERAWRSAKTREIRDPLATQDNIETTRERVLGF
jgi:hypothetical protein